MTDEKKILVKLSTLRKALDADAECGLRHFGALERSQLLVDVAAAEASE